MSKTQLANGLFFATFSGGYDGLQFGMLLASSQVLYFLENNNVFTKAQVVCNQKGLGFDSKYGVLMDVNRVSFFHVFSF